MSQPGAAPFSAFHSLFRQLASASTQTTTQSAASGLALLTELKDAGAGFFVAHPAAASTLNHLGREDPSYIAHEYMNRHFTPLHVADVMAAAGKRGLHYIGSGTPIENIDALSIPAAVLPLVQREKDPALRETLKDLARNQSLRRDLYMRDPRPLAAGQHLAALRARTFSALPGAPATGPLTFDTRIGPVEGASAIVTPVLRLLANNPARFATLEMLETFRAQPGLLNQILHVMTGAGIVHPVLAGATETKAARRLNAVLLERLRAGEAVPALAAPEIGSALPLPQEPHSRS